MRVHLGAIPNSPDFVPDESWKPIREPSPWLMQLIAFPIGVVAAVLIVVLWFAATPLRLPSPMPIISPFVFLALFAGIVVVHELIHAAVHPMAGRSPHSILGFWPSRLLFYAHYDGELGRNRFVVILLMPLLVISIVPLVVAVVTQAPSGWVAFVSAFNAFAACGDILGAGLILVQIPSTAILRNQGWKTYWQEQQKVAV